MEFHEMSSPILGKNMKNILIMFCTLMYTDGL